MLIGWLGLLQKVNIFSWNNFRGHRGCSEFVPIWHILEMWVLLIMFHNVILLLGWEMRDGNELQRGRKRPGREVLRCCKCYGTEVNSFFVFSFIFKLISSHTSLDDLESLVSWSCQLTSKVANKSQLLSSDARTYNLSSFVVCRTENTAKLAGRVCYMSLDLIGMMQFIHTCQKWTKKSLALLPFHSLQVVRKNYDGCRMEGNFSLDLNSIKNRHSGHNVGVFTNLCI